MLKNRVFVDSSILIAALLSSRGGSFYILTQLKDEFQFQINDYTLEEIFKVLDKKFYSQKKLKNYLFLLLGLAKIEVLSNPPKVLVKRLTKVINKEDAPILASALANSNYLLTLDKDFLNEKLRNFARENSILILTPKEFILN
ncbi:putative toxin-antitoxin system toxin component, PIN family [Candidatus Falkowbacteria bacterium CG_4_9_14_3_um_filter_38_19]|uniref:Putative toxin-antitoxin system toxin component, PIN family n=2 Tax=Candidatus Falkowiibacteriota TaxID=1752728 RepID=A0A2M6WS78_9BACT|nr:putative toxin-antitoxin system toxin component, PIN family [Candidatus Parcubacteria bacterium]PIT95615.1 MAG: putative toxin-antitoxin system toxin component, PIN family [Candidatus Falkowbacteria bacterium CG10_big_fil_rev_8_21_14_0_10_38_22]PJB17408.1 MAG: putative toxin-antitoxin system toxin component, PIN family [Candidatus Falkowbacteria bacterium CG_4_9_14_3_um_filter_38_19]